ncbi:MAG: hypothetical protein LBP73_02270 [Clostridiales Family XIII bacterium]|jgi:hypothetical protein|nr:hypothetical protein [Clostridiales Family XIII bacterium]
MAKPVRRRFVRRAKAREGAKIPAAYLEIINYTLVFDIFKILRFQKAACVSLSSMI